MPLKLNYTHGSISEEDLEKKIREKHVDNIEWLKKNGFIEAVKDSSWTYDHNPEIAYCSHIANDDNGELTIKLALGGEVGGALKTSIENDFLESIVDAANKYARNQFKVLETSKKGQEVSINFQQLVSEGGVHYCCYIPIEIYVDGESAEKVYKKIKKLYDALEININKIKPPKSRDIFKK